MADRVKVRVSLPVPSKPLLLVGHAPDSIMVGMHRRTSSYEFLQEASMGPTQRQSLADHPDNDGVVPGSAQQRQKAVAACADTYQPPA